jgi:hypothetical protein
MERSAIKDASKRITKMVMPSLLQLAEKNSSLKKIRISDVTRKKERSRWILKEKGNDIVVKRWQAN